ncbi:hypothetical protein HDV02_000085 [Globomyces sp. JEL0801]|nr:hypothetical protein HDV02_000085 [Globomyces sp. JEL0801]
MASSNLKPIVFAVGVLIGSYLVYRNVSKSPKKLFLNEDPKKMVRIKLSSGDASMNEFPGISTITYYSGKAPLEYLQQRTIEVIKQNPWLSSRLVSTNSDLEAVYVLDKFEGYFTTVQIPSLKNGLSFAETSKLLQDFQVKKGKECINVDEPLFRVTVVTTNQEDEFMVVFSISHTLADGFTFYSIYSMFEKDPYPMVFERVQSFEKEMVETLGNQFINFLMSPGFIFGILRNVLFTKPTPIISKPIDKVMVEKFKNEFKFGADSTIDFISTNDIITSSMMDVTDSAFLMMALNLRNRVPSVSSMHAGNYEGSLILKKPCSPKQIRSTLKTLKVTEFPSFWDAFGGKSLVVSNWTTFHHNLVLPGNLTPINHHPIGRDSINLVRTTAIIYKSNANQLNVLYGNVHPHELKSVLNLFL